MAITQDVDWVTEALGKVVKTIEEGASPLTLASNVKTSFEQGYRSDFEHHTEGEWNKSQEGLLKLSYLVGSLATLLTYVRLGGTVTAVDLDCAMLAGYLIAKSFRRAKRVRGHWCANFPEPPHAAKLKDSFAEFVDFLA